MRTSKVKLGVQSVVVALALCGTSLAGAKSDGAVSRHSLENKADYCQTCHGPSAQGFRGYFTMPRLAGQQPRYIENQLNAFKEHRRLNPIMQNVVTGITPGMIAPLAEYLNKLNPPPYGGAPSDGASLGKTIFTLGLPEANIPACSACHGPDARGVRQIPRLAGQLYWYVTKTLSNFGKERGQGASSDSSAVMAPIARSLSPAQISAIAAYVSTLR
jgi:cytochrome c553